MAFKYQKIALGGTFDLLHKGHKALILTAFEVGKFITIGITTDQFSKNTFEDQHLRRKNLKVFLKERKCKIIWLDDIFGTTLEDSSLEALVVSEKTKHSAQIINRERIKKGFKKIDIIIQPFIKDEQNKIISSTRIKSGEIDPEGISYRRLLLKIAGKKLSGEVRNELKKPLGKIVTIKSIHQLLISVGDVTTQKLLQAKVMPKLSIVDHLVGRAFIPQWSTPTIKVVNPAGQISKDLILAIDQALKELPSANYPPQTILVKGEEDLATIPAILLAPLGTNVVYGQPQKGAVLVNVDLEIKNRVCKLLDSH